MVTLVSHPRETTDFKHWEYSLLYIPGKQAAMHWDGTYRDRVWSLEDTFWTEEDYEGDLNRPTPSREIAKHLA